MAQNSNKPKQIEHILVAVDHSAGSRLALNAAALFAKITRANIYGLYVQDEHWEQVSGMPSTTVVNKLTGITQRFDENRLDRHIKKIANRLQREIEDVSRRHEVAHRWKSVRGQVIEEILKAGKEADLVTIGRRGDSMLQQKKMGSTARAIIKRSEKPVLVLAEQPIYHQAVTVVYDGTEESERGLQLGLDLAKGNRSKLFILALGNRNNDQTDLNKKLEQLAGDADISVEIKPLQRATAGNFIHSVRRKKPGLVIIAQDQPVLQDGSPELLLHYLKCAVLLMK